MKSAHEDIVTKLLSNREIIGSDGELFDREYRRVDPIYSTPVKYDLNNYMKTAPKELSRWGDKYMFVK